jgi:hypothetical protein
MVGLPSSVFALVGKNPARYKLSLNSMADYSGVDSCVHVSSVLCLHSSVTKQSLDGGRSQECDESHP